MRRFTITSLLCTIPLLGCGGDAPTAPAAASAPSLAGSATTGQTAGASDNPVAQTPIKGSCEVQTVEAQVTEPPVIRMVTTGACRYSHLGRTQIDAVQYINPVLGTSETEVTYTAANGDQVFATNSATFTPTGPTTVSTVGVTTITGGTGRFENATGRLNATGTADRATGLAVFSYDGWIAYDASNRR